METGLPPPILPLEVRDAIKRLKRDMAPTEENINAAILQDREEPFLEIFIKLLNKCIVDGKGPSCWGNASVVILQRKGDSADIKK